MDYAPNWPTQDGWTRSRLQTLKDLRAKGASLRQCASTLGVHGENVEGVIDRACWALLGTDAETAHRAMLAAERKAERATAARVAAGAGR